MEQFGNIFMFLFICIFVICWKNIANNRNSNRTILTTKTIPEKYINFPTYNGTLYKKPVETLTKNYERLTLFYKGVPDEQYLDTLYLYGFQKANNVRYEKDNTYVIFEKIGSLTKVAYHIKKTY